jgi:hypothetical protein
MNHHHSSPSSSSFATSTTKTKATTELEHLDALSIGGGHEEPSGQDAAFMPSNEGLSNAPKGIRENLLSKPKSDDSDEVVAALMDDCINNETADDMDMTI